MRHDMFEDQLLVRKVDQRNDPVLVSTDVEHILVLRNIIGLRESLFDLNKVCPNCSLYYLRPLGEGLSWGRQGRERRAEAGRARVRSEDE